MAAIAVAAVAAAAKTTEVILVSAIEPLRLDENCIKQTIDHHKAEEKPAQVVKPRLLP